MYEPPDTRSSQNFENLVDTFPGGNFVSFVGGGCSTPTGIPPWKGMLKELIDLKGLDLSVNGYEGGYPELASVIYRRYEELECADEYYDYLVSRSEPTECYYTSLHHTLIDTIRVHVTTNFDCVLEIAFARYKGGTTPSCQYFPHFNIDHLVDDSIVYLHANKEERRFVFRKEEFDLYYPSVSRVQGSDQIELFLRHLFERRHILFMGCGFNDRYLRECFKTISRQIAFDTEIEIRSFGKTLGSPNISHFALLPVQGLDDRSRLRLQRLIEDLEASHIHTICYRRHREIEDILLELQHLRRMEQVVSDKQAEEVGEGEDQDVL